MEWLVWMVAVAILGLAAVAASGRLGEFPATVTDTPQPHVPSGTLSGSDLRALRFAVVPRGYSMQQVDELLDRVSRQLDDEPRDSEQLATADEVAPTHQWDAPARGWEEPEVVEASAEVEPQPPLHDGAEVPPARAEEPPVAPSWRAAEVVYASSDAIFVDELEAEPAAGASPADEPPAEPEAIAEPEWEVAPEPDPESVADLEPQPEAAVDAEPEVVIAAEPELATEPEVMAEPEPATESEPVTEPEVAAVAAPDADAPAVATSGGSKSRRESKAKAKPAPAVPEEVVPEQVVPEQVLPVDELEAEIANIGDGQTVVAEYGAALDDLVSKYSFRKVEHWYELPGFDIPAPPDLGAPKEADEAAPGQDSTSEDI